MEKNIAKKVAMGIGSLIHIRKYVKEETIISLYYSLIMSHLDYCSEIWGNCNKILIDKLSVLQKKAIRIIAGLGPRDHTNEKFIHYKLLKLVDMVKFKRCVYVYKSYNLLQPTLVNDRYKKVLNVHNYNTRNLRNVFQVNANNKLKRNCISISGVSFYNKLPSTIKSCITINQFKKKLKE